MMQNFTYEVMSHTVAMEGHTLFDFMAHYNCLLYNIFNNVSTTRLVYHI
jgi:hypothetical protein